MLKTTNKPKEIPAWAKRQKSGDEIIFDGRLRRYRADLLGGCFRCADREDNAIGASLKCQIFDHRWITQSRYGHGNQPYFDIAFIDEQLCVSCLSLSRDSAINLAEWLRNLAIGEEVVFSEAICAILDMEKVPTESGTPYHVVFVKDWEFVDEKQFQSVSKFKKSPKYLDNQWQGVY